jgi:hypothetical protein
MANISGRVTFEGNPHGGVYVRLLGPSGEFVSEQYTKDDGEFTFHVAPGAWTLEARAAGATTATETVEVAGNGDSDAVVSVDLGKA